MSSLNYLDHGSRLRKDVSSIFEYCFIAEVDTSAKSGTKFQFKYPMGDDDPTINVELRINQHYLSVGDRLVFVQRKLAPATIDDHRNGGTSDNGTPLLCSNDIQVDAHFR